MTASRAGGKTVKSDGGFRRRSSRGVSLVELMVAVTIMTMVAATTAMVYKAVMKGLIVSKSRGIAARLAQDNLETLRGLSYDMLLVTPQGDLDIPPGVDLTNYPPETFVMGGKSFERTTIVSRVYRDSAGSIVILSPNAADTGLKQITTEVKFLMGSITETRSYTALLSDPGLIPLNATLYGLVTDTAGAAISNAEIFITENQNWAGLTSTTGYYAIEMDTKTYTVTVTKPGYWDEVSGSVTPVGPTQFNMIMRAKVYGMVSGLLTARPAGPLISGVFAGAAGAAPEPSRNFLELYNPATYQIMITDGITARLRVKHIRSDNSVNDVAFTWGGTSPRYIGSQKYFLIATDSPTINGASPDALFASMGPFSDLTRAGVAIQNEFGVAFDTVGWTNDGGPGPSAGVETAGINTSASDFGSNGWLGRKSSPSALTSGVGSSYDSGSNANDILVFSSVGAGFPRNSGGAVSPVQYGVPASSANVLVTDGYSSAGFSSSTGYYLLNSVTTGTWSAAAYWTTFSSVTASYVAVNTGLTTALNLLLEPATEGQGGISGVVKRSDTLLPIQGVSVSAGISSTLTDAAGIFILSLASGSYTVTANSGFANASFNSLSSTASVSAGVVVSGTNFNLVPSGNVSGKVTTNGTDPYPNVPVHALSLGLEVASGITNSGGNYSLRGIPAGAATIEPIIDAQSQSSTPTGINAAITEGATLTGKNFLVSTSRGVLKGALRKGAELVTTGALVIVSTSSFSSVPTIDAAYRSGSNVIYSGVSDSYGQYSLSVARASTYTVYGYLTSMTRSGGTETSAVSVSGVCVSSGQITVDLTW